VEDMDGYIDMHCHILPGVDDGAQDIEEMKAMLQIAYNDGIRCIIATPHHHPRRGKESPEVLRRQATILRDAAHAIDEKFRIYLGTEIYFGQDVIYKIKDKQILTMNNRDYVLIELSPSDTYDYIRQSLQKLQFAGYQVILAHVERYNCIAENIELAEQLWDMGIHLQINAGSIIGESGRRSKKFVKSLMDEELVFGVGTDAHDTVRRAPRMKKAAAYVSKKYGEDYMRRIFFGNAKEMLKKIRKDESR
ncbi:CpsB/CapC family capsule biosynthesis tyrosine phosphatase, partial [[Clostridium] scindens]|uniref:CpsB/CapC family capsule biosynthesis tyrosine phosphatase n=2 Tax=Clostridium scindens (strain JCM 10418 / VPI 12708) TaxID=29347 RepID=UPI003AB96887